MIIQCINCNKNFEVESSLIPTSGRNLKCGSCNHTWLYKPNKDTSPRLISVINEEINIEIPDDSEKREIDIVQNHEIDQENPDKKKNLSEGSKSSKAKKKNNFNINNIFSYLVIIIISFATLIIILDTFKTPLSGAFPSLELLLFNLLETIQDMFLFFKNLLG